MELVIKKKKKRKRKKKREREKEGKEKVNKYVSKRDSDATTLFSIPPLSHLSVTDHNIYVVMYGISIFFLI